MKKTQSIEWERPILDYRSPLTYELMMEYINVFSERYKNIAVAYIGESILGRAIPAVTLGDPSTDSGGCMSVLITGWSGSHRCCFCDS